MSKRIKASEAAEILGVHRLTLKNWRDKRVNLNFYKVGSRYEYDLDEVEKFKRGEKVEVKNE
jgi:excisionase family DNA binding protein